jgi:uncharacterized protein with HEPN domain
VRDAATRPADVLRAVDLIMSQTRGLDAAGFAERFGDGFSPFSATIGFALIVIGEACASLLEQDEEDAIGLCLRRPHIDWRGFVKLRHLVAHQYFRLRADLVWGGFRDELPALARAVRKELTRGAST